MAYFANGSEGEYLDQQCLDCPLGEKACPTLIVQLTFNYDQVDKEQEKLRRAMNMLVDEGGVCQTRKLLKEGQ